MGTNNPLREGRRTLGLPWGLNRYVFTQWTHREEVGTFLVEEAACAQAWGWEGLRAVQSDVKGKAGEEAGKVHMSQTMEQGPRNCI